VDYVDLQRRREERARGHQRPKTSWQSMVHDPLFLLGAGFVLGSVVSLLYYDVLYMGPSSALLPFVITIALLCYVGWLLPRRSPKETGPSPGSEKQLLLANQDAGGDITPVEAALGTSLTVDEVEEILTRFADRGHLVVQSRDGALLYALPGRRTATGSRTVQNIQQGLRAEA
jgi:hypothetical protein